VGNIWICTVCTVGFIEKELGMLDWGTLKIIMLKSRFYWGGDAYWKYPDKASQIRNTQVLDSVTYSSLKPEQA
jgi:hypothetical protein